VGIRATDEVRERVRSAVDRIAQRSDAKDRVTDALALARPRSGEPDLLVNFAEVIRSRIGESGDYIPGVRRGGSSDAFASGARQDPPRPESSISIDAVGAAVRDAFAGRVIEVTDDAVEIVTGALLLAMAVANRPGHARSGGEMARAALDANVQLPWEITHPILLDPVMWVVATAYEDSHDRAR
jgi:hypothetical protein